MSRYCAIIIYRCVLLYEVWQLSSRNAPVKAVINYLHSNGAVTFEVVSLRTNTLRESVFPLLKTFLELLFWNSLQHSRRMYLKVGNVWKSVALQSGQQFWE
jgi:hypothetical protein